eukprot:COSAG03_NODE_12464_length_546_cov_1.494407_2_plen_69_part_01
MVSLYDLLAMWSGGTTVLEEIHHCHLCLNLLAHLIVTDVIRKLFPQPGLLIFWARWHKCRVDFDIPPFQ